MKTNVPNTHLRWKLLKYSKSMENMNIFQKDGKREYIPKGWKIKLYQAYLKWIRFQLLGLPTHLSGRRQTTLAFLRRSNSCDSSFLTVTYFNFV